MQSLFMLTNTETEGSGMHGNVWLTEWSTLKWLKAEDSCAVHLKQIFWDGRWNVLSFPAEILQGKKKTNKKNLAINYFSQYYLVC
jgi:hypothetical protein